MNGCELSTVYFKREAVAVLVAFMGEGFFCCVSSFFLSFFLVHDLIEFLGLFPPDLVAFSNVGLFFHLLLSFFMFASPCNSSRIACHALAACSLKVSRLIA